MVKSAHQVVTLAFAMISKRIDRLVEGTKWPVALFAVSTLPLTFYAWWKLLFQIQTYPGYALMFAVGIGVFVVLARTAVARWVFSKRFVYLERDLTRSLARRVVRLGCICLALNIGQLVVAMRSLYRQG